MRELKSSDNNTLTLNDAMGGGQVVLTYRTPTTQERIAFTKSQIRRKGNQIISRVAEARLESAFQILTGIRRGDFCFGGVVLSSNPGEEGYRPDWKNLIYFTAADLLMILGQQVFEGEQVMPTGVEFKDDVAEFAAPDLPLVATPAVAIAVAPISTDAAAVTAQEVPAPIITGGEEVPEQEVPAVTGTGEEAGESAPLASSQTSAS